MEPLLSIKEKEIVIEFKVGCKCRSVIHLKNLMNTTPVAFKVESTAPEKFFVNPPNGWIAPSSQLSLTIILKPQSSFPEHFPLSKDQFLIKSTRVNYSEFKTVQSAESASIVNMEKMFVDGKLMVFFVGGVLLRHLVAKGAVNDVKRILRRQNSCNQKDDTGRTSLHIAATIRNIKMVDLLLTAGAEVDVRSTTGLTPLLAAVHVGNEEVVKLLLDKGADIEFKNPKGSSAMHQAASWSHLGILGLLIKRGAYLDMKDNDGRTPLHCSVTEGHADCVQALLKAGADKNAHCSHGRTALFRAASKGYVDIVEMLLDAGADPKAKNLNGQSAHDVALEKGHVAVVDVLQDEDSFTCMTAARQGDVKIIKKCIDSGVGVDKADQFGWTPLHYSAFKGHAEVVKQLVEHGADIESRDVDGHTPLHCAAEGGNESIVQILLNVGAKADAKTTRGATALQMSEALQREAVVSLLSRASTQKSQKTITITTDHKTTTDRNKSGVGITPRFAHTKEVSPLSNEFEKSNWRKIRT